MNNGLKHVISTNWLFKKFNDPYHVHAFAINVF